MAAVSVPGCQATVFLVTESHCSSLQSFRQGLGQFVESCQSGLVALRSCYTAVVTSSQVKKKIASHTKLKLGLGKWHCLAPNAPQTPSARRRQSGSLNKGGGGGGGGLNLAPLERILAALLAMECCRDMEEEEEEEERALADAATQLHRLLDKAPWGTNAHVVMDIHWFAAAAAARGPNRPPPLPPPALSLPLFGALLRATHWHKASVVIVTTDAAATMSTEVEEEERSSLLQWREVLEGVSVSCLDRGWSPLQRVIWRGALHFTEHKVPKQATHQSVAFPGLTLSLLSHDSDCPPGDELLTGVGLRSHDLPTRSHDHTLRSHDFASEQFSHLELMQVVDVSSVPLFWLSPLRCKLSLNATASSASVKLFSQLLAPGCNQSAGLLLCLCYSERVAMPTTHRSHSDWLACLRDNDKESLSPAQDVAPLPLAAYNTGPLLLACCSDDDQSDRSVQSCDAWFLWRPEAVDAGIFAKLKHDNMQIAAADQGGGEELLPGLPLGIIAGQAGSVKELLAAALATSSLTKEEEEEEEEGGGEWLALQTHEWLQRKLVHRIKTPELMFGVLVAPPPVAATTELLTAGDILSCFNERGSPTVGGLSPIAMRDPTAISKVHNPFEAEVSYGSIVSSTPTSKKRKVHGISYCFSQDDMAGDVRLTRIQKSCLAHEHHSSCSSVNPPQAQRQVRRTRPPQALATEGAEEPSSLSSGAAADASKTKPATTAVVFHPQLRTMKSPVLRVPRVIGGGSGERGRRRRSGKVAKLKRMKLEIAPPKLPMAAKAAPLSTSNSERVNVPPLMTANQAPENANPLNELKATFDSSSHDPSTSTLRRKSPRTNKWTIPRKEQPGGDREGGGGGGGGGTTELKPRKEKKKVLEGLVVAALKSSGMRSSHPCFRNCYKRLYNLSKSFLKDLKGAADTTLAQEIEKVVRFNVRQVIEFELRITGQPSTQ